MADLIQFVDSIASSPTVRLDLNDDDPWRCPVFSAPPPKLRRTSGQNAMRDGINDGSSSYDARIVSMTLDLSGTQDAQASQIQLLNRELDRAGNFLKYQPNGLTKPVFFVTVRSTVTEVEDREAQTPKRRLKVDILCQPFALGLPEQLGPYTVNNDPAHATNGCYFDVTGVIGDVMTPVVWVDTATQPYAVIAVRQHGTPATDMPTPFPQAESMTAAVDTSNPGGGPDAAMSGTGTNNYVRTTFAVDATMTGRLLWNPGVDPGSYRVLAVVRRSDNTSVIRARFSRSSYVGETVVTKLTTARQIVDLGVVAISDVGREVGYGATNTVTPEGIALEAERVSGAGTLDWDFIALFPADEQYLSRFVSNSSASSLLDSVRETFGYFTSGDPVAGGASITETAGAASISGSFPRLAPGRTNRFYVMTSTSTSTPALSTSKSSTSVVTLHYWPQYLHIRPSAS